MKNIRRQVQFRHFNQNDRDRLHILYKEGHSQKDIASLLGFNPSTISRELKRKSKTGIYNSNKAQCKANVKRSNSKYQGMKIEKDPILKKRIIEELETYRSPDEISGMLKRENIYIGKDAIYKWIYSSFGNLYTQYLCTLRVKKKKHKVKTEKTLIPNRISVHERPKSGIHGEIDCFVSPRKAHTTACASLLVIQSTKLMLGHRIPNLKPDSMLTSVTQSINSITGITDITMDNGIENRKHEQFPVRAYFCDPYSPWQKPLVEGSIGLLRRWKYAKGINLDYVSDEDYQKTLNFLNHKKRKSLGYKSAYEVSLEYGMIKGLPERIAFQRRI
jgi:transposase, IS30 family